MMIQRALCLLPLFLFGSGFEIAAASDRQINGIASARNHIHVEQEVDLRSAGYQSKIDITSNVPVTILRYSDDKFLMGEQPVSEYMAKVLVTSDCETSVSQVVPSITVSKESISVDLDVKEEDANAMVFLEPSSFSAIWTFVSDCFYPPQTTEPADTEISVNDPVMPGTDMLVESCNRGLSCDRAGSTCERGAETCCGVTHPSFKCDCVAKDDGSLAYDGCLYTDSCLFPSCCSDGSPEGMPPPAPGTCAPGSRCDSGVDDDYCCTDMGGSGAFCSKSGGIATEATTTMATTAGEISEGAAKPGATMNASTTGTTTTSTTSSVATVAGITTSAGTVDSMTEGMATDSTTTTDANGDSPPTGSPSPKPSATNVEQEDPDSLVSTSGAFNRSLSLSTTTAFVAIMVIALIFPRVGRNNNLGGYGRFVAAAMAISSGAKFRKSNGKGPNTFAVQNERGLETCNYNVEILIDGCNHPLEISAPSGRVVDVVIENLVSKEQPNCATDYEATLNFPVTTETIELCVDDGGTVNTLDGFECAQAVMGRPFIDATGGSIQAMSWIPDGKVESTVPELSWTGKAMTETQQSSMGNVTNHGQVLLGEDWVQRALGEHASVASFSAFSIALMSNAAPSVLVEDALKAGLDEIRHARTSFDIAKKLTGREVGPGPLPESKLQFGGDLNALAFAVAREGCVDETLSAFAAAIEVEHINEVLDNEVHDTPYSNIGRNLLTSIRNELITIATDESNHSALAWRTLKWVCSVDSSVCDRVYKNVFEESDLEMRFNQRAYSSFGEMSLALRSMREEWKKIFTAHQLANSRLENESVCKEAIVQECYGSQSLLASLTQNIIQQVSC